MRILSIDVGIKNLGYCIIDSNSEENIFSIVDWNTINLCNNINTLCCFCKKNAKYKKNDQFFCQQHAKHSEFKISNLNIKSLNKKNIKDLLNITKDYEIPINESIKQPKQELLKNIKEFIDNNYLEEVMIINTNEINLIDIGININLELNKLFKINELKKIDTILIENQISPIANRMKTIQGMIAQYFIINNVDKIEFISSVNKLKYFIENKKTTYNERKKIGIDCTKEILIKNQLENHLNFFMKSSKKDDLADSFLQGLYYLINNNKFILKNK